MPYPSLLYPKPLSLRHSITNPHLHKRHSNPVLSQSLWIPSVLVRTRFVSEPSQHLWREWGLILNGTSPLLPSWWSFSFALGRGLSTHGRSSEVILKIQQTFFHPLLYYSLEFSITFLKTKVTVYFVYRNS